MDFLSTLYQLIFMPLQIIFEVIYYLVFKLIGNPGISIIALSFIVNLLVLPLYNRADAMQEAERDMELKLSKGVEHIKKTFKGDEQLMMLQTYYRQNNYSPLDSIKGSISLFLEIPFFVAAYQFLSHLDLLNGAGLGPIKDLGAPDGLLTIAGMPINVLPFIMTAINLASAYIFTKDLTSKTKMQLYGMACFFLVFLYASPAGLVCYWTLNNIFNLIKTVICKMEDTDKGIDIAMFICSIVVAVYGVFTSSNCKAMIRFSLLALALNVRFFLHKLQQRFPGKSSDGCLTPQKKTFVMGAMFLALLVGGVIPSGVIEASPQEFVIKGFLNNPLTYIASSFAISFGTFVVWGFVFYWLGSLKCKVLLERVAWICCGVATIDYMFFGKHLGILTSTLQYENGLIFNTVEKHINTVVVVVVIFVLNLLWNKKNNLIYEILCISTIAMMVLVCINVIGIQKSIDNIVDNTGIDVSQNKILSLSKNGKNIIVFMLDRAMGTYVPYMFKEKPELMRQFDGFTYYANTISFGGFTNFGTPSLFGGYEYTPLEMNKRNNEFLKDKHNEALKVMPVIFSNNDYDVTVCDPTYANYQWIPDISIFEQYPKIKKYLTIGKFGTGLEDNEEILNNNIVQMNKRNFYVYGIMKSFPVLVQSKIYNRGKYIDVNANKKSQNQTITSLYTSTNTNKHFLKSYNVLKQLSSMTKITEQGNMFSVITNDATHEPCLLQLPEYVPAEVVNNTEYERNNADRFVVNGKKLKMKNQNQVIHYHANMASLMQLGNWFDFMRENNVYDNTRIILVADHGRPLQQLDELILDDGKDALNNVEFYFPLMMVKDFNSKGFVTSNKFMTNADVPTIAMDGVIDNPINPFTGKNINNKSKYIGKQYVLASYKWDVNKNNGKTYLPGRWYSVHSDIWNKNNWKVIKENDVLPN